MQTEWGIVIPLLALVGTALGAVWAVAQNNGGMRERIRTLEAAKAEMDGEMKVMQASLAKGDTRFAVLGASVEGMKSTLAEIKALLTAGPPRRAAPRDDGDDD